MLLGGTIVNALGFSGSNYLFSILRNSGIDEECKHHDKAVEELQAAQEAWFCIYYSPQIYWKRLAAITKLAKTAQHTQESLKMWPGPG